MVRRILPRLGFAGGSLATPPDAILPRLDSLEALRSTPPDAGRANPTPSRFAGGSLATPPDAGRG